MTTIHMNTEQVRDLAQRCGYIASEAQNSIHTLRSAYSRLSWAWHSSTADRFRADLLRSIRILEQQAEDLRDLSFRVNREVDEWLAADSHLSSQTLQAFNVFKSTWELLGSLSELFLEWFTKHTTYEEYREFGRMINRWLGNQRGGGVGFMDDFGHFIESDLFKDAIFPTGIATISGLLDGEKFIEAVTSGGIESVITQIIPGANVLLLISGIVQIAGNSLVQELEKNGHHDEAVLLQNRLDAIDLGGYIEDLSDAIADMILPPYNDPPDFSAITERASEITDLGKLFFG